MTEFEAPKNIRFEGPLRSPHLSEEADKELDRMVDTGQATAGQAWREVTKKHGTVDPPDRSVNDADEHDRVPIAAPPKPGETDEQIRQRHRDALRAREIDTASDQSQQAQEQ